jgi:hypothetical protein
MRTEERATVLRHLAALHGQGVPAGEALSLIAAQLPAGGARRELEAVQGWLERGGAEVEAGGEPGAGQGADPTIRLLARAVRAPAAALELATSGLEAASRARRLGRSMRLRLVLSTGALLAALLGLPGFLGRFRPASQAFGGPLPAPTRLLFALGEGIDRAFVPLLGAGICLLAILWVKSGWFDGSARLLESVGRLRLLAAAVASGVPEAEALAQLEPAPPTALAEARSLRFDPLEQRTIRSVLERSDLASACRILADERELRVLDRSGRDGALELGLKLLALLLIAFVLVAFYLPIFSVAGSIQ